MRNFARLLGIFARPRMFAFQRPRRRTKEVDLMKKLWLGAAALAVFLSANLGITPNLNIRFNPPSPPDVCDCGTICMMHVTCDVPKCNGRIAQETHEQDDSDLSSDDSNETL